MRFLYLIRSLAVLSVGISCIDGPLMPVAAGAELKPVRAAYIPVINSNGVSSNDCKDP